MLVNYIHTLYKWASQVVPVAKNPSASAGDIRDTGFLGSGRSPGGGHDNPLQYSYLESPMDRGAWQGTVHGITKSQTKLSDFHFTHSSYETKIGHFQ